MTDENLVCSPEQFLAADPVKRRELVRTQIDLTPELWRQGYWMTPQGSVLGPTCGTAYCFAGWALHLAGEKIPRHPQSTDLLPFSLYGVDSAATSIRAGELLGIDVDPDGQAFHELFESGNGLGDIDRILKDLEQK